MPSRENLSRCFVVLLLLEEIDASLPLEAGVLGETDLVEAVLEQHVAERGHGVEHLHFDQTQDLLVRYTLLQLHQNSCFQLF